MDIQILDVLIITVALNVHSRQKQLEKNVIKHV